MRPWLLVYADRISKQPDCRHCGTPWPQRSAGGTSRQAANSFSGVCGSASDADGCQAAAAPSVWHTAEGEPEEELPLGVAFSKHLADGREPEAALAAAKADVAESAKEAANSAAAEPGAMSDDEYRSLLGEQQKATRAADRAIGVHRRARDKVVRSRESMEKKLDEVSRLDEQVAIQNQLRAATKAPPPQPASASADDFVQQMLEHELLGNEAQQNLGEGPAAELQQLQSAARAHIENFGRQQREQQARFESERKKFEEEGKVVLGKHLAELQEFQKRNHTQQRGKTPRLSDPATPQPRPGENDDMQADDEGGPNEPFQSPAGSASEDNSVPSPAKNALRKSKPQMQKERAAKNKEQESAIREEELAKARQRMEKQRAKKGAPDQPGAPPQSA